MLSGGKGYERLGAMAGAATEYFLMEFFPGCTYLTMENLGSKIK
jgi:hypothetical protein